MKSQTLNGMECKHEKHKTFQQSQCSQLEKNTSAKNGWSAPRTVFQYWHCVSLRFHSLAPRGIVISTGAVDFRLRIGKALAPAPFRAAAPSYSVKETTGAELGSARSAYSASAADAPAPAAEAEDEEEKDEEA